MRDYAITASKYSVVPGDSKYEIETQRWIWASFLLCALETGWLGLGAVSCECKETGFNTQKTHFGPPTFCLRPQICFSLT